MVLKIQKTLTREYHVKLFCPELNQTKDATLEDLIEMVGEHFNNNLKDQVNDLLKDREYLCNELKNQIKNKYKVGLIPHHTSYEAFAKLTLPSDWILIDPRITSCDFIFEKICQCELIISESLHGLVVSDSFEIPNIWLYNRDLHAGGDFKFRDYFLSIGRTPSLCYRVDQISKVLTATTSQLASHTFQMNTQVLHAIKMTILCEFNRYAKSKLF